MSATFTLLFLVLTIGWGLSEIVFSALRRSDPAAPVHADRGSLIWINVAIYAALPLAFAAAAQNLSPFAFEWRSLRWLGLALVVSGALLKWIAVLTLRSRFTVDLAIAADQKLERRGPYRVLRHPSYSGTLLSFAGLGVALGDFVSIAVLILPIGLAFLNRVRIEEDMMCAAFPSDYPAYREATWALAPLIY